jgi:hypothetical protein
MVNQFLMAVMNRLSPLITRNTGPWAAAVTFDEPDLFEGAEPALWLQDLKLFAMGWVGGLVFFGTLIS